MPFTIGNYIQKNLSTTSGFLRAAALLLAATGIVGGTIVGYGTNRAQPAANSSLTDEHIAANIYAKENTSGCVSAGTSTGCVQIIVGVTNNMHIFNKSGGIILGRFSAPSHVFSGVTLRVGGSYPRRENQARLQVQGMGSGSALHADSAITSSGTLVIEGATRLKTQLTAKANLSGRTLFIDAGAAHGKALCQKTTGAVGFCSDTPTNGSCTCN